MKRYIIWIASGMLCLHLNVFAQAELDKAKVEKGINDAKIIDAKPDSAKNWKFGATFTANFSNVGLSNWQGGGQNAISLGTLFTGFANYKKDKHSWANYLEMGYGLTRIKELSSSFRKTDDRLVLTSKYGYEMHKSLYLSGIFDFRTTFAPGYNYASKPGDKDVLISDAFAPAWIVTALGAEYKPNDKFYLMASPLTSRITIVNNTFLSNAGAYGVDTGKNVRSEFGAYMNSRYKLKVMDNINLQTTLTLFMNYKTPALLDVFWDNAILMTVNKYVSVNFSTNLIYDDDIKFLRKDKDIFQKASERNTVGPGIQFRHTLNVGLVYKLL